MSDMFGPATLVASQGFSAFSTFLPKLSEVRKATNDPDMVGDVRLGEVAAVTVSLGIGAIASSLTKNPIPVYSALFISIVLLCVYETALRGHKVLNPREA